MLLARRQEEQEQQWAQPGQYQYDDQAAAAEPGRQQEHLLVGMGDDLCSLAQRTNQLARFLQQQIDQIGREE